MRLKIFVFAGNVDLKLLRAACFSCLLDLFLYEIQSSLLFHPLAGASDDELPSLSLVPVKSGVVRPPSTLSVGVGAIDDCNSFIEPSTP